MFWMAKISPFAEGELALAKRGWPKVRSFMLRETDLGYWGKFYAVAFSSSGLLRAFIINTKKIESIKPATKATATINRLLGLIGDSGG